ncbi:MAG: AMP-binding protein [Acetobacteraceae bacterium]|nr:AMP-binding protein [Acetobacteraceae bacterium]
MGLLEVLGRKGGPGRDRVALRTRSGTVSRGELWALASRLAGRLKEAGVEEGARVALLAPNSPSLVAGFFAPAFLGAAVVPLDARLTAPEVAACLEHAGAAALLCHPGLVPLAREAVSLVPSAPIPVLSAKDEPGPVAAEPAGASGPALYCYTSGSTGRPKAVELDHAALTQGPANFAATVGLGPADRVLAAIPLSHSYGFAACLLPALVVGAEAVLLERPGPGVLLSALVEGGVTYFPGVPFWFDALLRCYRPRRVRLSPAIRCLSAGSPLDPAVAEAFEREFGAFVGQEYGTSETGPISADLGPSPGRRGSVGLPLAGVSVRVVDAQGRDLPPGSVGEVAVKTSSMACRYFRPSGREAGRFSRGWFFTGDRGRMDAQGYLYLEGRRDRAINLDGLKVDPDEVERVLLGFPGVAEAVVVEGRVGRRSVLRAVLAPRGRAGPEAVRAFCQERLAPWKVPELVEFRDRLPRSPLGKVALDRLL